MSRKSVVPSTSKEAWKQVHPKMLASHYGKLLSAMRILGKPSSMEEIGFVAGLTYEQSHKRFKEMCGESLIYINGQGKTKSGRKCNLYSLVNQTVKIEEQKFAHQKWFTEYQDGKHDPKQLIAPTQLSFL